MCRDLWCSLEGTPACQAGGRGFKSRQDRATTAVTRGRVAQLVERAPEKREVTGSTPVPTTRKMQVVVVTLLVEADTVLVVPDPEKMFPGLAASIGSQPL